MSTANGAECSPPRLNQLNVLLQQLIDEIVERHALGLGALGQVLEHRGIEIHRQSERCSWAMPFAFRVSRKLRARPRRRSMGCPVSWEPLSSHSECFSATRYSVLFAILSTPDWRFRVN